MSPTCRHDAIQPEELDLLQRVFDQLSKDTGLHPSSVEAENLGAFMFTRFQAGTRDGAALLSVVRLWYLDLNNRKVSQLGSTTCGQRQMG